MSRRENQFCLCNMGRVISIVFKIFATKKKYIYIYIYIFSSTSHSCDSNLKYNRMTEWGDYYDNGINF